MRINQQVDPFPLPFLGALCHVRRLPEFATKKPAQYLMRCHEQRVPRTVACLGRRFGTQRVTKSHQLNRFDSRSWYCIESLVFPHIRGMGHPMSFNLPPTRYVKITKGNWADVRYPVVGHFQAILSPQDFFEPIDPKAPRSCIPEERQNFYVMLNANTGAMTV